MHRVQRSCHRMLMCAAGFSDDSCLVQLCVHFTLRDIQHTKTTHIVLARASIPVIMAIQHDFFRQSSSYLHLM